jgi:hypothetical protein
MANVQFISDFDFHVSLIYTRAFYVGDVIDAEDEAAIAAAQVGAVTSTDAPIPAIEPTPYLPDPGADDDGEH